MKHSKEAFYCKYEKLVYKFLWDYFKSEDDKAAAKEAVAELFQQVWVRVFHSFHAFDVKDEAHTVNYLRVISKNVYLDHIKYINRELEKTAPAEEYLQDMVSSETVETALFTPDKRDYLRKALERLCDEERNVIMEYYFSGREGKETASLLNMNHNTLRTKVNRACKKLRKEMERLMKEGGDLDE